MKKSTKLVDRLRALCPMQMSQGRILLTTELLIPGDLDATLTIWLRVFVAAMDACHSMSRPATSDGGVRPGAGAARRGAARRGGVLGVGLILHVLALNRSECARTWSM